MAQGGWAQDTAALPTSLGSDMYGEGGIGSGNTNAMPHGTCRGAGEPCTVTTSAECPAAVAASQGGNPVGGPPRKGTATCTTGVGTAGPEMEARESVGAMLQGHEARSTAESHAGWFSASHENGKRPTTR